MVNVCCDRCGETIKERYYTIHINGASLKPEPATIDFCGTAASAYSYINTQRDTLQLLNSQPMYCESCKEAIEKFINNND